MTVHQLDAIALGYTVGNPDGTIEAKFAAIGDHLAIGHFRHHRDLVAALIAGPCHHIPTDLTMASNYVLEHSIPVTLGNVLADGSVVVLSDCAHRVNASSSHEDDVRQAINHLLNRAA